MKPELHDEPAPPARRSVPWTTLRWVSASRLSRALADRYRVERELGRGGMATVFIAEDLKHGRPVAIKVLHPELGAWLGAERFLWEIRITARLRHPNIFRSSIREQRRQGLLTTSGTDPPCSTT